MPKLRNNNDSTHLVLSDYLHCEIKSSKPRVHHRVCEERCRRVKKCPYYKEWYAQHHEEEIEKSKPKPKRKKVVRRVKKKVKKKKLKVKVVSASCSS